MRITLSNNESHNMHTIITFLKFGSEENIKDLFDNGTVYLNTIEYFRKIEDEELRGDSYEGTSEIINSLPGTFRIPNIEDEIRYEKIHIKKAHEIVLGNLYCLYCVSSHGFPNPFDFKIDERNLRFGTHCLMMYDNQYLLDSIANALQAKGLKYSRGFVEYYDKEKVSKKLTLFDKPNNFEHQKEFRFYVQNDDVNPITINIGPLHGKAKIYRMEDIAELKLGYKNV